MGLPHWSMRQSPFAFGQWGCTSTLGLCLRLGGLANGNHRDRACAHVPSLLANGISR